MKDQINENPNFSGHRLSYNDGTPTEEVWQALRAYEHNKATPEQKMIINDAARLHEQNERNKLT